MEPNYNYTCPSCSQECAVALSFTGANVLCPNCSQDFFATPPDTSTEVIVPEKLPFFKFGKRKLLEERLEELVADGEMSDSDENVLHKTALMLGLDVAEVEKLEEKKFIAAFVPIQRRIEKSWQLTDYHLQEIEALQKKFAVKHFTIEGHAKLFRQIYLLETKNQFPEPVQADLMLDANETAYVSISSTWHQTRVKNRGYAGASVSIPTGIKGVRFRFGQYAPVRTEEITALSGGMLYVTNKRVLFHGTSRNTKVELKKIADATMYSDCVKIEKYTGKPDFFSMNADPGPRTNSDFTVRTPAPVQPVSPSPPTTLNLAVNRRE
jgi:hypothetical protein